jgi:hypothetical protein
MLGNGDGTFQTTKEIAVGGSDFGVVIAGYFNGDGNTDIALLSGRTITVLLGKSNGTFGSPITSTSDGNIGCAAAADFNNDGKLDLTNGTSVYLGKGDGTFQSPISLPVGGCGVAVADFNHDGNLDLIAGDRGANLYLGNGTGHFSNPTK